MTLTKAKMKLYSDQIIQCCLINQKTYERIKSIFNTFKPFVIIKFDFISSGTHKQTKKHIIHNISLGYISFRINKDLAKKIGIYPYNKRKYQMTFKSFYKRESFRSKTPNRISGFHKNEAVKHTIHFSSVSHKDVKKFELTKLLTWIHKLDKDVFLKLEKILFEFTG